MTFKTFARKFITSFRALMTSFIHISKSRRQGQIALPLARFALPAVLALVISCAAPLRVAAQFGADPASVSFGNVMIGDSGTQSFRLMNPGTSAVTVSRLTVTGTAFCISGLALPATVASGASVALTATFTPTSAGSTAGSVSIVTSASSSPTVVALSGTGAKNPSLTFTPDTLAYASQAVGTTSAAQTIELKNTSSGPLQISSITGSGSFAQTDNCSSPVAAGTSCTISVTFTPTAVGNFAGSITIADSAAGSPQTVALTGTGTKNSSTNTACTGTAIAQTPANVTSLLPSVGEGVTVTQITSNSTNWNMYADLSSYSSLTNVVVYNYGNSPAAVASSNLDGTDAQVISGTAQGSDVIVSIDGQYAYYQGQNSNGSADIYAVPVAQSGACQQVRWTDLNMQFIAPAGALVISNSSIDPATGHNVVAFSNANILYRVEDNGTELPALTLPDPENADVFHRLRLNPVFPNIMYYKRDDPAPNPNTAAQPEIWIIDLNNPTVVYSLMADDSSNPGVDHASWSNDGTKLGFIYNGYWWVSTVVNSNGTLNLVNGALPLPAGWSTDTPLGPPRSSGLTVNYCNLSPDGSVYVCAENSQAVYLMSLDGTQTKFLADPDSSPTAAIFNGIPKPQFLDMQNILFSSDRTGTPEVYIITGFTTTFP